MAKRNKTPPAFSGVKQNFFLRHFQIIDTRLPYSRAIISVLPFNLLLVHKKIQNTALLKKRLPRLFIKSLAMTTSFLLTFSEFYFDANTLLIAR